MKKIYILMAGLVMLSFLSCGPSKKDQEKQKKTEDSIAETDRSNALGNADKILSDTTAQAKDSDTKKKVKK